MSRTRKAWEIVLRYREADTVIAFQPSASKARAEVIDRLRDAWGCSWKQALGEIRTCRRAPERDVRLPDRHPLTRQLSYGVLDCVVHAYGGTGLNAGKRDHFYTSDRDPMPKAAYYHGLFEMHRVPRRYAGGRDMVSYTLTALGRNVARGEAETYPRF